MDNKKVIQECDMDLPIRRWLEKQGYTVYSEIQPRTGGRRADLLAEKNKKLIIVELKLNLGLKVMDQAFAWLENGWVHQVYIAVPKKRGWDMPSIAHNALLNEGIGFLEVDMHYSAETSVDDEVIQTIVPRCFIHPEKSDELLNFLTPYHLKNSLIGGSKSTGKHLTAYAISILKIKEYLAIVSKWTTAKEISENVTTHYLAKNKAACIAQALKLNEGNWCEYSLINNRIHFKIKEICSTHILEDHDD